MLLKSGKKMADGQKRTYITMTTIPERLTNDWFYNNLQRTISLLSENQTLLINIPRISSKNILYNIPPKIKNLQGKKFIINNCEKDEGPITKILPTLRNSKIPDESIIIVCDDDIVYKKNTFNILENCILKNPDCVSSMCNISVEGFKTFGFTKKIVKPILNINIPTSCFRVDDDVMDWYFQKMKLKIIPVPYEGNTEWYCTLNKETTDGHPDWTELNEDEKNGDRARYQKTCKNELSIYNNTGPLRSLRGALDALSEVKVWTYWEPSPPPNMVKSCYRNWGTHGHLENINILTTDNITRYIPEKEYQEICSCAENLAVKSDFIGLYLLHRYGGLWIDASVFFNNALENWMPKSKDKFFCFAADRFAQDNNTCMESFFMYSPINHPLPKKWYELLKRIAQNEGKSKFLERVNKEHPNISQSMDENYLWVYVAGKYLLIKNPELKNSLSTLSAEKGPSLESEKHGWDNHKIVCDSLLRKKCSKDNIHCNVTKLHNILRDECQIDVIP